MRPLGRFATATLSVTGSRSSGTWKHSGGIRCTSSSTTTSGNDPAEAYRTTLGFLSVDRDFEPEFEIVNANRWPRLQALANTHAKAPLTPTGTWSVMRRVARMVIPSHQARARLHRRIMRANTVYRPRRPLPTELRERLEAELAEDVRELGALLDRDLSHWIRRRVNDPSPPTSRPAPDRPLEVEPPRP